MSGTNSLHPEIICFTHDDEATAVRTDGMQALRIRHLSALSIGSDVEALLQ